MPSTPPPRWYADAAAAAAGLSLAVVVVLWLGREGSGGGTGIAGSAGRGGIAGIGSIGTLSSAGRLTGLLASDLLLLQVLLMARIPMVERAYGQERLTRWHHRTGFASFWLMAAHVVLIVAGYAGEDRTGVWRELWSMVVTFPGMLLGTAGTVLLLGVVVTSVRAARRRLRYESWHLLHLYAYLGAGLALPHQLWTGRDFLSSPAATAYWWTLWGVAAGAVLAYRIGLPLWRNVRHRLVVDRVVAEGPGLTSVYLRGRRLGSLPVRSGQYFQWRFLDGPGWSRAHPYSLSASPASGSLRITVKSQGDGSARIAGLRPGTRVLVEGPYGRLTGDTYTGGPLVLLACGIGIAPLLSLLGSLPYGPGEATLIYRARGEGEVAFRTEIDWLAGNRGVRVVYLLGPRAGRSWLPIGYDDPDPLRGLTPDAEVFVCGPPAWSRAVRGAAREAGVPAVRLHIEHFTW